MWNTLVSKLECPLDNKAVPPPESFWWTPDFSWMTLLCFFENHNNGLHFSLSIFLPLSSHPPLSYPKVASVGNYHYVFIQGQPTEEAVVLALSAGVLLAASRGGRKEGWMSAEELYSCLQARPHLSRLLLWRWPSCHHAVNTKPLHEGQLSLSLFSHPVCQILTLSQCLQLFYYFKSLYIIYQKPFVLKWQILKSRFWWGDTTRQRPINYIVKPWWRKYLWIK